MNCGNSFPPGVGYKLTTTEIDDMMNHFVRMMHMIHQCRIWISEMQLTTRLHRCFMGSPLYGYKCSCNGSYVENLINSSLFDFRLPQITQHLRISQRLGFAVLQGISGVDGTSVMRKDVDIGTCNECIMLYVRDQMFSQASCSRWEKCMKMRSECTRPGKSGSALIMSTQLMELALSFYSCAIKKVHPS